MQASPLHACARASCHAAAGIEDSGKARQTWAFFTSLWCRCCGHVDPQADCQLLIRHTLLSGEAPIVSSDLYIPCCLACALPPQMITHFGHPCLYNYCRRLSTPRYCLHIRAAAHPYLSPASEFITKLCLASLVHTLLATQHSSMIKLRPVCFNFRPQM